MSARQRLQRIEQSLHTSPKRCPEHASANADITPRPIDWRAGLALMSPDADEREAARETMAASPQAAPCHRCGWSGEVPIRVIAYATGDVV